MSFRKRLLKEAKTIANTPTENIRFTHDENDITMWKIVMTVPENPLYKDQEFTVEVDARVGYPISAPIVRFINNIPVHPHIYSNGHICLNILGDDWTPVQTIRTIGVSLHSLLRENTRNTRPEDNDEYVKRAPNNPNKSRFEYHDDEV